VELLRALEQAARERLDPAVYDYYAGGAGDEQTLADNVAAWRRVWLRPRALVDVSAADPATELLGHRLALPVLLAPMAAQRLLHPDGEVASARAAGAAGTVFCLSTRATADVAEVAAAAGGPLWFQLYVTRDRARTERMLGRLRGLGVERVVLTVDLPVAGRRERELRHGELRFPDGVRLADHLGGHAAWEVKPLGHWDASLTWADVAWVREASGLPVLVKGVLTAEDALAALQAGAEGVVVSNHGGRQLDGVVPTAVALREVAAALAGRAAVLVDGGVRDGADVVRALALGADAVLVGRPFAWGLAVEGEAGVRRVLAALRDDVRRTLQLAGCTSPAEVGPERVRLAGW
jgi:4-hydroxymandelate oxidase